jgi:ABC-type transport system involved in multi-copper enzyme maturation permease subunit
MVLNIAKKEFLFSITTLRFSVLVLICCLLMPISVWVLSSDYNREREDYNGRVELEQRRQAGKEYSINVSRPTPQLSALFRGVSIEAVNNVDLKFGLGWNRPNAAESQSDTHALFPSVDLSFIIGIVFSAMALMLAYDTISGEKEKATFRLMMSSPVPRSSVVIGKWLGLTLTMIMPFFLGIVISILLFLGVTSISLNPTNWMALILILLVCVAYLSVFILLGITISALSGSNAKSIIGCFIAWGVLTMILPQATNVAADSLAPAPSTQAKEKDIRLAHNEFCETMRNNNIALADRAIKEGWEYSRVDKERRKNQALSGLDAMRKMNAIEEEFWLRVAEQENLAKTISVFSPFGSLNVALISLADTGPQSQRAFLTAAYRYGELYFREVYKDDLEGSSEGGSGSIPKFSFSETPLGERLSSASYPAAMLIIFNVVLIMAAVIAFNRYDVR